MKQLDGQLSIFDIFNIDNPTVITHSSVTTSKSIDVSIIPKAKTTIPGYILKELLCTGTGFKNGKYRIISFYHKELAFRDFVSAVKHEYGISGCSCCLGEKLGLHGYNTIGGKGINVQWVEEDGPHECLVSWNECCKELISLIQCGAYTSETLAA